MYCRFFQCSHLAVGCHRRRRTPRCPHGRQLSRVKVFLTDHMHTRQDSLGEALGRTHFFVGEKNVALSFSLSLFLFLARSQALLWAHRCCRPVSSCDRSSNSGAYGLRWRGTTSVFPYDGPFFSRILAWRSVDSVNRTFRIAFKTFCIGSPRNSFVPWETSASESCDTQLNCDTLFTIATTPLSSFSLLFGKWPSF